MAKKTSGYAQALVESLHGVSVNEQRARVSRFKKLLKKRGDLKLLSSVLQEFAKRWEQRKGKAARVVWAARPSSSFAESMKQQLGRQGYVMKEETDSALIRGAAVFLEDEYLLDGSVQGKLNKLRALLKT